MKADFVEEIYTGKSPDPIPIEGTETILSQMKNSICKISKENGEKGTGFFCKIPIPGNFFLPILITNNHILNEEDIENNKIIKTTINDDKNYINIIIENTFKVIGIHRGFPETKKYNIGILMKYAVEEFILKEYNNNVYKDNNNNEDKKMRIKKVMK